MVNGLIYKIHLKHSNFKLLNPKPFNFTAKKSFLVFYHNVVSFCLKQAKISANRVIKIILIQRLNNFLAPLADIFTCFKQKLTTL